MQRKKKSKKKISVPSVPLTSSEETFITSILNDFQQSGSAEITSSIQDTRLAMALIERLPLDNEYSIRLLSAINDDFDDKQVRKAVKKALFKLKKKGFLFEDFENKQKQHSAILKPIQDDRPYSCLGPLDRTGLRAVLFALHRNVKGVDMGFGLVSDDQGIQQFLFNTVSKKQMKEMKNYISEEAGPMVETSLSHVTTLLESAYVCHSELNSTPPADYLEIRPWLLENVSLLERPVIYDFISEESVSDGILTESVFEKLFEHELMGPWLIESEVLQPYMEDIQEVKNSPIVLSETRKFERIRQIKQKCMEELFPPPKRILLKHRFEEMAFVFFKLGDEDTARQSLAISRSAKTGDSMLEANPLIEFMLERSIDFYTAAIEEGAAEREDLTKVSEPGIILP